MPLYEFYCEKCNKVFEELFESTSKNTFACPLCGTILWRQISKCDFHLKGHGWTDDKRKQSQRWYDNK